MFSKEPRVNEQIVVASSFHKVQKKQKEALRENEKFKQAAAVSLVSHTFTHEDTSETPQNL